MNKIRLQWLLVLGLENEVVENICNEIKEVVVPQTTTVQVNWLFRGVIRNRYHVINSQKLEARKSFLKLPVGGAFHSPLMEPARAELEQAIDHTQFCEGICPIYQNVTASPVTNLETIKENLKKQLTSSVLWTQTMQKMVIRWIKFCNRSWSWKSITRTI